MATDDRPYMSVPVDDLAQLARTSNDVKLLTAILAELAQRSSTRAKELEANLTVQLVTRTRGQASQAQQEKDLLLSRIAGLERQLSQSIQLFDVAQAKHKIQISQLERQLKEAKQADATPRPRSSTQSDSEKLYAKVGLTPQCSDFVLEAVRRVYLKKLHPDSLGVTTTEAKKKAEESFKDADEVFRAIAKLRAREGRSSK